MGATVSGGLFRLLRNAEPALTDQVLERAGMRADSLGERVDHELVVALCALGTARDPLFGVKAAKQLGPIALELVDVLVRSSATFLQGLETTSRYRRLLHEALFFHVIDRNADTDVECGLEGVEAPPALLEFGVSLLAIGLRNAGYRARGEIYFAHESNRADAYEALLGMRVRFGAPFTGGRFCSVALRQPIPSADPQLHALITKHADGVLARIPRDDGLVTRVRSLVSRQLDQGPPNFEQLARQLRMSPRTLRRRLVQGGVRYHTLVDDARREVALRYLERDAEDLAFMLGFSDASAFRRAFKRWTGSTPSELRNA